MNMRTTILLAAGLLAPSAAMAQLSIDWSTLDCGGGTTTGGSLELSGTIGQPDATEPLTGGTFQIIGGFWPVSIAATCYANCDGSTTAPVLGPADFSCFLSKFRAGDAYANCDGSTTAPVLGPADFSCFLSKFRAGCP